MADEKSSGNILADLKRMREETAQSGAAVTAPPVPRSGPPTLPPPLTEDLIARAVAKGILEANTQGGQSDIEKLWDALFSGPAPHATRFGIVPYFGFLRLAFGEQYQPTGPVEFRAAVTLSDQTAYELWKYLGQSPNVQFAHQQAKEQEAEASGDGPTQE